MQTPSPQTVTWASVALETIKGLGPAILTLLGSMVALRHQRKLKAKELTISSTLRARELMFGVYEKRLASLLAQSAALGETVAKLQVVLNSSEDQEKMSEAASGFFSVIYSQALQMPEYIEEVEEELAALGLAEKFAERVSFIKTTVENQFNTMTPDQSVEYRRAVIRTLLQMTSLLINIERAIVDGKAKELFQDYLPSTIKK